MMPRTNLTRRGFIAGLGIGLAGVALAACGGAQAPAEQPTAAPAAAAPTTAPAAAAPTTAPAAAPTAASAAAPTTAAAPAAAPAAPNAKVSGDITWLVRTNPEENKGQSTVFEPMLKQQLPNLKITRIVV